MISLDGQTIDPRFSQKQQFRDLLQMKLDNKL